MAASTTSISKPVFAFNRYFYDLIKAVKEAAPELKERIRANYRVKLTTPENLERFAAALDAVPGAQAAIVAGGGDAVLRHPEVGQVEVLKDVPLRDVVAHAKPEALPGLAGFVYVLTLLRLLSEAAHDGGADGDALFDKSVAVLALVQLGKPHAAELEDIFDDDVRALLASIASVTAAPAAADATADAAAAAALPFLEGTKIGAIAKEISEGIDLTSLDMSNPADLLNNSGLLTSIVSKVGTSLQTKMAAGEIKHEELLSEAMGMLNMFGGAGGAGGSNGGLGGLGALFDNPMFKELAKAAAGAQAGGGGGGGKARVDSSRLRTASARDRLRRKHEQRSKGKKE